MRNWRARLLVSAVLLFAIEPLVNCGDASFSGADADGAAGDGAADGPLDGQAVDGGIGDASTSDSPVDPCTGAEHWICDNFDRTGTLTDVPYWEIIALSTDASLIMAPPGDPAPPSIPNALLGSASGGEVAAVTKAGATAGVTPGAGLRCEVDFRIDKSSIDYTSNLVILTINATPGQYRLVMAAGPADGGADGFYDYGTLPDGGTFVTSTARHDFARGTWNHLAIEAAAGSGEPRISVNGASVSYLSSVDVAAFSGVTGVSVQIGLANYNGSGAWAVAYDNAYCDLIP